MAIQKYWLALTVARTDKGSVAVIVCAKYLTIDNLRRRSLFGARLLPIQ
jgi:hypothetical protein